MERIIKPALVLLGYLIFIVTFFIAISKVDNFLKLKAMGDCANSIKYEKSDASSGVTVSYPADELYKKCLKDKGYSLP